MPSVMKPASHKLVDGEGGGGEGGGKGDGGGDGGCSRGTAHQVGRLRALWQRTVWLVGKEL